MTVILMVAKPWADSTDKGPLRRISEVKQSPAKSERGREAGEQTHYVSGSQRRGGLSWPWRRDEGPRPKNLRYARKERKLGQKTGTRTACASVRL
jgi:hypothetical protein